MKLKNIELLSTESEDNITCKKHSFKSKNVHWHTYYELELVVGGRGIHVINGTPYPFREGDIFLLTPTDFHSFELEEEGTTYLIEIPPSLLPSEILKLLIRPAEELITNLGSDEFDMLKGMFLAIEEHYQKDGYIDALIARSLLNSLLSLFIGYTQKSRRESVKSESRVNIGNRRLGEILLYIQCSYRENITLESIADSFFISKEYLSRLFRSEIGVTLTEYLRSLRLAWAAKLIITTDMKSIDISELSGFGSIATFMRCFKKEYGISPLQMRESYRPKE